MLDTHQLNVFLTAAGTLNFTEAARRLHMTQPSVSQHMRSLEQSFGVSLFVRSGPRVDLSDAGRTLVPLAEHMVNASLRIEETMQSLQGSVYGHIHIGCSTTLGKYLIPKLLAQFMEKHPQVTAACQLMSTEQAIKDLLNNRIHLALTQPGELPHETLQFRPFMSDAVSLIVPANHPWLKTGSISPKQLLDENFILREEGSGSYHAVDQGLRQVGLSLGQLRSNLTLWNSEAIAIAVQEGGGVGFVSDVILKRLHVDGVRRVAVRGVRFEQVVHLGYNHARPVTVAQNAIWQHLLGAQASDRSRLNAAAS